MIPILTHRMTFNNITFNPKKLLNFIKEELTTMDYDVDDTKYKYQGKIKEIKQVMFLIIGDKNLDNYTNHKIHVEVTADKSNVSKTKNKKLLTTKRLFIVLKSEMTLDYDHHWEDSPILSFFKKIYEKYIYVNNIEDYGDKVAIEMIELENNIKSELGVI